MNATLLECAIEGRRIEGYTIVDAHGHVGSTGTFDVPVSSPDDIVEIMDRIGIDVLCASHMQSLYGNCREGNDLMAEAVRRFPSRFIGYIVVDPNRADYVVPELKRCLAMPGMKGIKVHTDLHHCRGDAPEYMRAYEYAESRGGIPVLIHGMGAATASTLARTFPNTQFIIAHVGAGCSRDYYEMVKYVSELGNLYLDVVGSIAFFGAIEEFVAEVGADKLLYGSDVCFLQATHQIGRVLCAEIAEEDKLKILGLNAMKLFHLEAGDR